MRRRDFTLAASLALVACGTGGVAGEVTLLCVSFDPTGDLFEEFNAAFSARYRMPDGRRVRVFMSHGGSGKQSRAVIDGLDADVVSLALQSDIDQIAKRTGKVPADWRTLLPNDSAPFTSTMVLLVRRGNPRGVIGWDDLIRPDVSVVTPSPKTSGGARWNYLAAWAHAYRKFGGDEARVRDFVGRLYRNVTKLDIGARGATTTFTRQFKGDVLITWENEAWYTLAMSDPGEYEVVYPALSIRAEPPVAVVPGNAEPHGRLKAAQDYVAALYSDEGQRIAAKHYFRPFNPSAAAPADLARFRDIEMISIDDPIFGGWSKAQPTHFAAGAIFDQIYQPPGAT